MAKRPSAAMLLDPEHLISLGFGAGLSPLAPGTMGTIVGVLIFSLMVYFLDFSIFLYFFACGVLFVLGVYVSARTSKYLEAHDHGAIVIDEIVGFLVSASWIPLLGFVNLSDGLRTEIVLVLVSFVLFRFFDIVKPWPIGWIDRQCAGGFGIMLDDLIAGIITFLLSFSWVKVDNFL